MEHFLDRKGDIAVSLTIFDLDNTLIGGDSDHLWGEYLIELGIVEEAYYRSENNRFYHEYKTGQLDILEFLAFSLKPLSENSLHDLLTWRQGFLETKIHKVMLPKAKKLIDQHRKKGDTLLIITATNRFVSEKIADLLAIPHLLATEPEFKDGAYTGKVDGVPCFQDGKVKRLDDWLAAQGLSLEGSYFYSDSHNDLPLLRQVDHPVVVDADPLLLAEAEKANWPVMSLR